MEGDAILLADRDSGVLASKAQLLQPITLPPEMEAHVFSLLTSEPSNLLGLVLICIRGNDWNSGRSHGMPDRKKE